MADNNDKILKAEYVQQVILALNLRNQSMMFGLQMYREKSIDELKSMLGQFLGKERYGEIMSEAKPDNSMEIRMLLLGNIEESIIQECDSLSEIVKSLE